LFRPVFFNGKFYSGGLNGVHRVADRLIRECDARLAERPAAIRPDAVLLAPETSDWVPELTAIRIERIAAAGQVWEQLHLPRRAAGGVLVNLANLAPVRHRRKLTVIHDAQFLFNDCGYAWRQRLGYRALAPWIAASSEHVVTVSDFSRRMLGLFGVAAPERTRVIANGADHILDGLADDSLRKSLGLNARPYAVMFGSPKPYKNSAVVFAAFAENLDGLALVVVGPGKEELAAAGMTVPSAAVFAGRPTDAEFRGLLEGAAALAFPSRTEGFGLPPLEAMLCGCPVVTSPAGAIPEVCGDAVLYAGVDDPAAWRIAILQLRDDQALRQRKIAEGRDRARHYTWKAAGDQLMGLIDGMAAA
jgi:glycosyltransferase involved in cell wall biosynthesis